MLKLFQRDDRSKLSVFDFLTISIFVLHIPYFSSFISFKNNSYIAFFFKPENISKVSDSSCVIKSCSHSNSCFNSYFNSYFNLFYCCLYWLHFFYNLVFTNKIYKSLISPSISNTSKSSLSISTCCCSPKILFLSDLSSIATKFNSSSLNSLTFVRRFSFLSFVNRYVD